VKIVGRKAVVGRPFMYGTTRDFLERFGLNDINDLPKVEDMSELLGFDLPGGVKEPAPQTALPFEPDVEAAPAPDATPDADATDEGHDDGSTETSDLATASDDEKIH